MLPLPYRSLSPLKLPAISILTWGSLIPYYFQWFLSLETIIFNRRGPTLFWELATLQAFQLLQILQSWFSKNERPRSNTTCEGHTLILNTLAYDLMGIPIQDSQGGCIRPIVSLPLGSNTPRILPWSVQRISAQGGKMDNLTPHPNKVIRLLCHPKARANWSGQL